jgi:response regulator RpfG family c-di-GMP phosphodiesterase
MPKVSGWEILKTIRNNPKTEALPVLLMSKMDDVKDIVEGFELGADDYIVKPFNFSVLLARIRAALRSRVLISELNARESRLALAETLNDDMKKNLTDFQRSIDGIAEAILLVKKDVLDAQALNGLVTLINEKVGKVRKNLEGLEDRMYKTANEWEGLKKKEIDFPILEKPIRDTVSY